MILCLLVSQFVLSQKKTHRIESIGLSEGLSQSFVSSITKDSRGFMWFGTEDGLNKYDGNKITIYRHEPGNPNSLSSSYITDIIGEEEGYLLVSTRRGLNKYNPHTDNVIDFNTHEGLSELAGKRITALFKNSNGHILAGSSEGLYVINEQQIVAHYVPSDRTDGYDILSISEDPEGYIWIAGYATLEKLKLESEAISREFKIAIPAQFVWRAMLSDSHFLWIGTDHGIMKLDRATNTYEIIPLTGQALPISNNIVQSIASGPKGYLLLGTSEHGVVLFDKATNTLKTTAANQRTSLNANKISVSTIYIDSLGIQWFGTHSEGVQKYDPFQLNFDLYQNEAGNSNSLHQNAVRALLKDRDGEVWVGTHGGLNRIQRTTGKYSLYKHKASDTTTISSNVIRALAEDSEGTLWVGTWSNGLNSLNKQIGKFRRYEYIPNKKSITGAVRALAIDADNLVWIGGHGLASYNPVTEETNYYLQESNAKTSYVYSIFNLHFAADGVLWIGTDENGLLALNTKTKKTRQYLHNPKDTLSLSHNYVTSIAEDVNGNLWVGTYGGGLNKFDLAEGTFKRFNISNGLQNDVIYGIQVDALGFVWFSSNAGLCRMNPSTESFQYFGTDYGIQSEEFNSGATFKSTDDELFFGGIKGFNSFYPDTLYSNKKSGNLVFTGIEILNEGVTEDREPIPQGPITTDKNVYLGYDQNTVSISFAELNYANNVENIYQYQLLGNNKVWKDIGNSKEIVLGNLSPGKYTLHLRIVDTISQTASLGIIVSAPFWKNSWAYFLYGLIALGVILFLYFNYAKYRHLRRQFELRLKQTDTQSQQSMGHSSLGMEQVTVDSIDEKFLHKAIEVVEQHLDDTTFDVNTFVSEMLTSRTHLHRKLKEITGYSATGFIRFIRLNKAAKLLAGNAGSVSEIAYQVGFENVGYFSKCFKGTYGVPPSQYTAQNT